MTDKVLAALKLREENLSAIQKHLGGKFMGRVSGDPETWLGNLALIGTAYGQEKGALAERFYLFVASEVWEQIKARAATSTPTWEAIELALRNSYGPEHGPEHWLRLLETRYQAQGESVREFSTVFVDIVRHMPSLVLAEQHLVFRRRFLPELQDCLATMEFDNFTELETAASALASRRAERSRVVAVVAGIEPRGERLAVAAI